MQGKISKKTVDSLQWREGEGAQQFLWDNLTRGFGVYVLKSGLKVYVAQFRRDGKSHRVKIGAHGRLTPEDARAEAKKILGGVALGENPAEERRAKRASRTVRMVGEDWLTAHVKVFRKRRTAEEYERLLHLHVYPAIGDVKLAALKRQNVLALQTAMKETPIGANRALAVLGSLWSWAAANGECEAGLNPVRGIERFRETSRERFLTGEELARLGDALREAETVGLPYEVDETKPNSKHAPRPENRRVKLAPYSIAAIRLLLLTGARLREILDAQWSQLDVERGILFLPDSKTGKKPLFLSEAALDVLAGIPRLSDNPHVIPGAKAGEARAGLSKPWSAVRRAAGLEGLRLHDLRHSFASFGAGESLGLPILGKLLGHSQPSTTAKYAHLDVNPMRRAVNTIAGKLGAVAPGRREPPPSEEDASGG